MLRILFIIAIVFCTYIQLSAQEEKPLVVRDSIADTEFLEALRPSKAAFYSTVFPGLGHFYIKKYWPLPIVYVALATGIYVYTYNNDIYQKYRTAFKLKNLGEENEYPNLSLETLERAQKSVKKDRDLSLLAVVGVYILQIVWASVDAHLEFYNTDNKLSFIPLIFQEPITANRAVGMGFYYRF